MSDRVSGHPGRSRLAVRAALLLASLGLVAGPLAPLAAAAGGLTLTTPFPSIVAEPGQHRLVQADPVEQPGHPGGRLKADGVPDGWTARFPAAASRSTAPSSTKDKPVDVTLDVEIPADPTAQHHDDAGPATSRTAPSPCRSRVRVADAAAGDVTLTSDFPELKGPSSSTFTFNLTLKNGTAAEETFSLDAQGPAGWTVTAKPPGQAQATSTVVAAGGTSYHHRHRRAARPGRRRRRTRSTVTVTGGGKTATSELTVTITGTYTLDVSTPNQVLSTTANAGTRTDLR